MRKCCTWAGTDDLLHIKYHDVEWVRSEYTQLLKRLSKIRPEEEIIIQPEQRLLGGLITGTLPDMKRCKWVGNGDELYIRYHDEEWGVPLRDDQKLFEFMVLESAQAGLSWRTILHKREGYRKAFKNFDPKKVARMTSNDVKRLMNDASIVRNRLKIESTITNAKHFLEVQKEFGSFDAYMWSFTNGKPIQSVRKRPSDVPAVTDLAITMAKELKKRGFKFLGPTVWYAHMQAVGMVNDHTIDCFRYREVKKFR